MRVRNGKKITSHCFGPGCSTTVTTAITTLPIRMADIERDSLKDLGWTVKRVRGREIRLCPGCSESKGEKEKG